MWLRFIFVTSNTLPPSTNYSDQSSWQMTGWHWYKCLDDAVSTCNHIIIIIIVVTKLFTTDWTLAYWHQPDIGHRSPARPHDVGPIARDGRSGKFCDFRSKNLTKLLRNQKLIFAELCVDVSVGLIVKKSVVAACPNCNNIKSSRELLEILSNYYQVSN